MHGVRRCADNVYGNTLTQMRERMRACLYAVILLCVSLVILNVPSLHHYYIIVSTCRQLTRKYITDVISCMGFTQDPGDPQTLHTHTSFILLNGHKSKFSWMEHTFLFAIVMFLRVYSQAQKHSTFMWNIYQTQHKHMLTDWVEWHPQRAFTHEPRNKIYMMIQIGYIWVHCHWLCVTTLCVTMYSVGADTFVLKHASTALWVSFK